MIRPVLTALLIGVLPAGPAAADSLRGGELVMHSTGEARDGARHLDRNGYVAAYLQLEEAGPVTVWVDAVGTPDGDTRPRMGVAIFGHKHVFHVKSDQQTYDATFDLPAGTHFLRVELSNDLTDTPLSLGVTRVGVDRGRLVNDATDGLALASAETWIERGRRGPIAVKPVGLRPGERVRVRLLRHHRFNLGANVPGTSNVWLDNDDTPRGELTTFARHFLECFTATVPSNAGKWAYNEPVRDQIDMTYPDIITGFAREHGLRMRMHTLIWDTEQQPGWAIGLLDRARAGDAEARAELREQVSERIGYYVRDRAQHYDDLDVLNEALHQPGYLDVYGVEGIAEIYREAADAVRSAGADTRLYTNEYNVLQWSRRPPYGGAEGPDDPYANWYRDHVESLLAAGAPVGGIGVQYYANAKPDLGDHTHSAARIQRVYQNLAITGLPVSLTEFGVARGATPDEAAKVLTETMRMTFGTPEGDLFLMFGFYRGGTWERAREACLYDEDWNLTVPGRAYHELIDRWTTTAEVEVGPDGTLSFTGFYGTYEAHAGDRRVRFTAPPPPR